MSFKQSEDFIALLRLENTQYKMGRMPPLDFVIYQLGQAGFINLSASDQEPTANQDITAWLDPSNPSYGANGVVKLWDRKANAGAGAYVAATPELFGLTVARAAGLSESEMHSGNGAPLNTAGDDGDFWLRTDNPGGLYGPKANGAWPPDPAPGTTIVPANEVRAGVTQTATQEIADAGIDDFQYVTPKKLAGLGGEALAKLKSTFGVDNATETKTGVTKIATQAIANSGTDNFSYMTSLRLANLGGAALAALAARIKSGILPANAKGTLTNNGAGGLSWAGGGGGGTFSILVLPTPPPTGAGGFTELGLPIGGQTINVSEGETFGFSEAGKGATAEGVVNGVKFKIRTTYQDSADDPIATFCLCTIRNGKVYARSDFSVSFCWQDCGAFNGSSVTITGVDALYAVLPAT